MIVIADIQSPQWSGNVEIGFMDFHHFQSLSMPVWMREHPIMFTG
jgi:hypothetical protein